MLILWPSGKKFPEFDQLGGKNEKEISNQLEICCLNTLITHTHIAKHLVLLTLARYALTKAIIETYYYYHIPTDD